MKKTSLLEFLKTASKNAEAEVPIQEGVLPIRWYKDPKIIIANATGQGMIQDEMTYQKDTPAEFAWAQEALKILELQYNAAKKHPGNQWLISLFAGKGGVLAVSNYGDTRAVVNAIVGHENLQKQEGRYVTLGSSMNVPKNEFFLSALCHEIIQKEMEDKLDINELDACLSILISGKVNIVALNSVEQDPNGTTLIHELTHQADNGMSQSKLFKKICEIESTKGGVVSNIHSQMAQMLKDGVYSESSYHEEMLARVVEERTKNPIQFKQQNPLMDAYLEHVFYPLCMARVCNSEVAESLSKSPDILNSEVESSDKRDERLDSSKYMQTTYAKRLQGEMKRFHEITIPRFLDEAYTDFHYNLEHPSQKVQDKKNIHSKKLTMLTNTFVAGSMLSRSRPENRQKESDARARIRKKLEDRFLEG